MNKLAWIVIALIATLGTAVLVSGAQTNWTWNYEQTVTVTGNLDVYLGNEEWVNGTLIDWGSQEAGASYVYDLNVKNLANGIVTVSLTLVDLPLGWTEVWEMDGEELEFEEWANGTLTLTIPPDALIAKYTWDSYIKGEYT